MRNITGQAVTGPNLYGRDRELALLWEKLEQGEHILMVGPRRVGKTSLMLELCHSPRSDWDAIYVDVEAAETPADVIAAVIAELMKIPRFQGWFESLPILAAAASKLKRADIDLRVGSDALRVSLTKTIGRDWTSAADSLEDRLTRMADERRKLLISVDELPVVIVRMLRNPDRKRDTELLLSKLRALRHAPSLRGAVCTLIGGSVSLEGVLRRARLPALINDVATFYVAAWDAVTAANFLGVLGKSYDFPLSGDQIQRIIELLGDPVPYHVQLFFQALREVHPESTGGVSPSTIKQCFDERLSGPYATSHLEHYMTRLEITLDEQEFSIARGILDRASRRRQGVGREALADLLLRDERSYRSVVRNLEADGYLIRTRQSYKFRSNLVRNWWRKRNVANSEP